MTVRVTKQQALVIFLAQWREAVSAGQAQASDLPAKRESWNNYTDSLCKDQLITEQQCDCWSNPF